MKNIIKKIAFCAVLFVGLNCNGGVRYLAVRTVSTCLWIFAGLFNNKVGAIRTLFTAHTVNPSAIEGIFK